MEPGLSMQSRKGKRRNLETDSVSSRSKSQFFRDTIGLTGLIIVLAGGATTLSILAFLIFLWFGEGTSSGEDAPSIWRWVILSQWVTQAVTLSTVVIRIAITSQASLFTSLIAAVMLERHGVPLSRIAEVSLIRASNDGPLRLGYLLVTSVRKSPLQAILALILLFTSFAIQFSSTILVSDLASSALVNDPQTTQMPVFMTTELISLNHQTNNWLGQPTSYSHYGEISPEVDTSPNDTGVSDTGATRRVFLPVAAEARSSLRRYEGKAFTFNSRFVCVRPTLEIMLSITTTTDNISTIPFSLQAEGNISYSTTFSQAGLDMPPECEQGSCFPSSFNCSLPQFQLSSTQARQGFTDSICLPAGDYFASSAKNFTLSESIIPNYAAMILFFRTNGTYDLWRGPNLENNRPSYLNGNFRLRDQPSSHGEWVTYNQKIGGLLGNERITNGVVRLDVSMCFQQAAFDFSDVELSTDKDLVEPSVTWDSVAKSWNTTAVRTMLGVSTSYNVSDQGNYNVDLIENSAHINTSQYFTNKIINNIYNSPNIQNTSLFMDTQGSGRSHIQPHIEYQAIFQDTLNTTNRPGVAMQATLTALSGSIINEAIAQFDGTENVTTTSSIVVLAPRHFRGLLVVIALITVNMLCGIVIIIQFLVHTHYSSQGNYWHAVSQIISEHTAWILEDSTQSTDDVVAQRLKEFDPEVKITLSERCGRVQPVMQGYKT